MKQPKKRLIHFLPVILLPLLISTTLVWAFFSWVNTSARGAETASPVVLPAAAVQTPLPKPVGAAQAGAAIVSNDGQTIVLEFSTPEYQIETQERDGRVCQAVVAAGLTEQRNPAEINLPTGGAWIGIPPEGETELVVLEARAKTIELQNALCPVVTPDKDSSPIPLRDASREALRAASSSEFLPKSTAEILSVSMLRSQRVAMLRFSPFQYNPATGELRYYPLIRVQVRLPAATGKAGSAFGMTSEGAFEDIYRASLLNYEQAKGWRQPPQRTANDTGKPSSAGVSAPQSATPGYKIVVDQNGIYSVTYEALQAAGADVDAIDPALFSLTNKGDPVAIEVVSALSYDFQPGDYLLFYGQPETTKYTLENVYWLRWDAEGGARIGAAAGAPTQGYDPAESYTHTVHLEQNTLYRSTFSSGPERDHFFWQIATAPSTPPKTNYWYTYTFSADQLAGVPVSETVKGMMRSLSASPRHHTQVYLNNHAVGDYLWYSGEELSFSENFPESFLIAGTNVISMVIPLDGISYETFFVNWFEVNYQRKHHAINNLLEFEARSGPATFHLSGFSSDDIQVLDITDPAQPSWVTGAVIDGSDPAYTATIEQNYPAPHQFYAFTGAKMLAPKRIIPDVASDLHSTANAADYIVITPSSFSLTIQTLLTHRAAQGLRVANVDLQDIFDEFNYGNLDPNAIHDFLEYAYHNWSAPAPMYVLLVGDGHYDYLDKLGFHQPNPMPPLLGEFDLWIVETVSDSRLVAFDGAVLPSMFIGRLPVNDTTGLTNLINKIISYEGTPFASWMQNVTFVADDTDLSVGDTFYNLSNYTADYELPAPYVGNKIYFDPTLTVGYNTSAKVRAAVKADINSGRLMVSYVGHGSTYNWGSPIMFNKTDANALTNTGKYPFMVPMTCLDGYFIDVNAAGVDVASLGETIVKAANKGAVASFSPTGYGLVSAHDQLERGLFRAFFEDYIDKFGPATTQAKYAMMASSGGLFTDTVDTFNLLGDPATRMPAITHFQPNPGITMTGVELAPVGPERYVQYSMAYTNTGTGQAAHLVISDTLPAGLEFSSYVSAGMLVTQTSTTPLNFSVKKMAPNASGALTVTARIVPGYSGSLDNTVEISTVGELETTLADNRADVSFGVQNPDVAVSVVADIDDTIPPSTFTYTLNYANIGQETATGVLVTFTLPASIENIDIITSGAILTQVSAVPLVYEVADLGIGEAGAITVTAQIVDSICSALTATGAIVSNGDAFSYSSNNYSEASANVPCPDVVVSMNAQVDTENYPPYHVTFPLVYANNGQNLAQGVVLTFTLPASLENIQIITSGATLTQVSAVPLSYEVADLAIGAGGAITVTADVTEGMCGMLIGSGAIDSSGDPFSPESNNFVSSGVEIPCPDVAVSLVPTLDGDNLPPYRVTFPLFYANTGQSDARGVVLTYTLPSSIVNIDIITTGATLTQVSAVPLVYEVADLGIGEGGAITATAEVVAGFCGSLAGSGAIDSFGDRFNPSTNNYVTAEILVPCPDVAVSLATSLDAGLFPPHTYTYTVQYSNTGEGFAQSVVITNTLPSSIENIQVITSGATLTQISSTPLVYEVSDLATGEGGMITIMADVSDAFYGNLVSTVEINASADTVGPSGNNFVQSVLQVLLRIVLPLVRKG